jgi:carbonic anhydrase
MKIREGFESFRDEVFPEQRERFEQLGSGQQPETLFVTCSDSRIDPALITQTLPGEIFVIRNAGNFIDTKADHSSEVATIEYGVRALGVKHIVICGHSHCGAVDAALHPETAAELPHVTAWLQKAGPDLTEFERIGDRSEQVLWAAKHNVKEQLARLRALPFITEAEKAGQLELHGWVYRFELGEIRELNQQEGTWHTLASDGEPVAVPGGGDSR